MEPDYDRITKMCIDLNDWQYKTLTFTGFVVGGVVGYAKGKGIDVQPKIVEYSPIIFPVVNSIRMAYQAYLHTGGKPLSETIEDDLKDADTDSKSTVGRFTIVSAGFAGIGLWGWIRDRLSRVEINIGTIYNSYDIHW